MTTITAQEFVDKTTKTPEWAKSLTEPTVVIGCVSLGNDSPIQSLSPLLDFQHVVRFDRCPYLEVLEGTFRRGVQVQGCGLKKIGQMTAYSDEEYWSGLFEYCLHLKEADGNFDRVRFEHCGIEKINPAMKVGGLAHFIECPLLKVAEGTFHEDVFFNGSGIEKIGELHIVGIPGKKTPEVAFDNCSKLKVAEGVFPGCVSFFGSGVEKIGNLTTGKNEEGRSADFSLCYNLKVAEGTYPGRTDFANSGVEEIRNLKVGTNTTGVSSCFTNCKNLRIASGEFEGAVNFESSGVENIENLTVGLDHRNISISFRNCPNLQSITGKFVGAVNLYGSGVKSVAGLEVGEAFVSKVPEYEPRLVKLNIKSCEALDMSTLPKELEPFART